MNEQDSWENQTGPKESVGPSLDGVLSPPNV